MTGGFWSGVRVFLGTALSKWIYVSFLAVADRWGFLLLPPVCFSMLLAKPHLSATLPLQV